MKYTIRFLVIAFALEILHSSPPGISLHATFARYIPQKSDAGPAPQRPGPTRCRQVDVKQFAPRISKNLHGTPDKLLVGFWVDLGTSWPPEPTKNFKKHSQASETNPNQNSWPPEPHRAHSSSRVVLVGTGGRRYAVAQQMKDSNPAPRSMDRQTDRSIGNPPYPRSLPPARATAAEAGLRATATYVVTSYSQLHTYYIHTYTRWSHSLDSASTGDGACLFVYVF